MFVRCFIMCVTARNTHVIRLEFLYRYLNLVLVADSKHFEFLGDMHAQTVSVLLDLFDTRYFVHFSHLWNQNRRNLMSQRLHPLGEFSDFPLRCLVRP